MLSSLRQIFWPQLPARKASSPPALPSSSPFWVFICAVGAVALAGATLALHASSLLDAVFQASGGARELGLYFLFVEEFLAHHHIHWSLLLGLCLLHGFLNARRTRALYAMSLEPKLGPWDRKRARDIYYCDRGLKRVSLLLCLVYLLLAVAASFYELSNPGHASQWLREASPVQERLAFIVAMVLGAWATRLVSNWLLPRALTQATADDGRTPSTALYRRINCQITTAEHEHHKAMRLLHAPLR